MPEQQKRELILATKRADAATVRRLLQAGVDANTTDMYSIPAVLWAATNGDVEAVKALLAAGADVRSKDKQGRKALLYYLLYRYNRANDLKDELVQSLIEAGSDVNAVYNDGTNVLTLAKQLGDAKLMLELNPSDDWANTVRRLPGFVRLPCRQCSSG